MLVYKSNASWLWYITRIRGSALVRIRGRLSAVFVISVLMTLWQEQSHSRSPLTLQVLAVMGLALGIFLGFRNNTSYDRFWEGRKLWGQLVNTARSLSREIIFLIADGPGAAELKKKQIYRLIAYVHSLRMNLRGEIDFDELSQYLSQEDIEAVRGRANLPNAINLLLAEGLREAVDAGLLNDYRLVQIEGCLKDLSDIQGGCERILSTPIPLSYSILIHRIVALYVFSLPFGLVDTIHWYTPIIVLIVSYTFLGLDAVGSEIEDPFGKDLNDLPLSTLSRMIEVNLRQSLGEEQVPELLQPINAFSE